MRHPILYEINTRAWLRELSEAAGRPVTLADIPDSEIAKWRSLGFTHIWLLGVWQVGEGARDVALRYWRETWSKEIASNEADVHGSPFAIREYNVDSRLGQVIDLLLLKERFSHAGLHLILDFVPNHLSLDSPEPTRYPARFVQAPSAVPGTFEVKTKFGKRHFTHGRDPYFPPWTDTIQLDYRVAETHESMAAVAQTISMFGNGLRCDMAMLLLPEIFEQTWRDFPSQGAHQTMANFWRGAIPAIRQLQPHVDLIAEAYWDREQQLQDLGFDYTYNKKVTDFIARREISQLSTFLSQASPHFLRRSVHFLENHDEPRIAVTFPLDLHKAAALLILSLPGMALLHEGQLEGRTKFARIQLSKRAPENPNPEISRFYQELLRLLPQTWLRRAKPHILAKDGVIAIRWEANREESDLALINLTDKAVNFEIPLDATNASTRTLYRTGPEIDSAFTNGLFRSNVPAQSGAIIRISAAAREPLSPETE